MLQWMQHRDLLLHNFLHVGYFLFPKSTIFRYSKKIACEHETAKEIFEKFMISCHVVGHERVQKKAKMVYDFWQQ